MPRIVKQIAQYQDGRLELQDVPQPTPPPGGVLVRTTHSVISIGTEKMKVEQARMNLLQKARARPDQVRDFSYDEIWNGQRPGIVLEERKALLMVSVIGVDVRVERPGVDEDGYRAHSSRRISSMRSEMSLRPLRPAPVRADIRVSRDASRPGAPPKPARPRTASRRSRRSGSRR